MNSYERTNSVIKLINNIYSTLYNLQSPFNITQGQRTVQDLSEKKYYQQSCPASLLKQTPVFCVTFLHLLLTIGIIYGIIFIWNYLILMVLQISLSDPTLQVRKSGKPIKFDAVSITAVVLY